VLFVDHSGEFQRFHDRSMTFVHQDLWMPVKTV